MTGAHALRESGCCAIAAAMPPRKHPVDDPAPSTPNPIAPVDEPREPPEPPIEEPDDAEPPDT